MQIIRGDYVNLLSMKRKGPWEIVVKAKNDEHIMHILLPMQKGKTYRLAIIVTIGHNSTLKLKKRESLGSSLTDKHDSIAASPLVEA